MTTLVHRGSVLACSLGWLLRPCSAHLAGTTRVLEQSESQTSWIAGDARVVFESPAAGVLVFRMTGRMHPSFVPKFEATVTEYAQRGEKVDLFFDTAGMTGYHPEFRE